MAKARAFVQPRHAGTVHWAGDGGMEIRTGPGADEGVAGTFVGDGKGLRVTRVVGFALAPRGEAYGAEAWADSGMRDHLLDEDCTDHGRPR